ncbi:MAG: YicC/YloC family endoribonuclease, partial [Candidatus Delongbacteria bacterium]
MTGYGKSTGSCPDYEVSVEIKSVNHRFLDL